MALDLHQVALDCVNKCARDARLRTGSSVKTTEDALQKVREEAIRTTLDIMYDLSSDKYDIGSRMVRNWMLAKMHAALAKEFSLPEEFHPLLQNNIDLLGKMARMVRDEDA